MKKLAWTVGALVGAFVVLALLFDAYLGVSQARLQPGPVEGVLVSTDAEGQRHETRLAVFDDGDTPWVQSGHWFRGWYWRVVENPEVELIREGETHAYTAVPLDTPEGRAQIVKLIKRRTGETRFWVIRAVLLFAEIKPVRLDPR
jgi:hypothetical protein